MLWWLVNWDLVHCYEVNDLKLPISKQAEPEVGHSPGDAPGCCVFCVAVD